MEKFTTCNDAYKIKYDKYEIKDIEKFFNMKIWPAIEEIIKEDEIEKDNVFKEIQEVIINKKTNNWWEIYKKIMNIIKNLWNFGKTKKTAKIFYEKLWKYRKNNELPDPNATYLRPLYADVKSVSDIEPSFMTTMLEKKITEEIKKLIRTSKEERINEWIKKIIILSILKWWFESENLRIYEINDNGEIIEKNWYLNTCDKEQLITTLSQTIPKKNIKEKIWSILKPNSKTQ